MELTNNHDTLVILPADETLSVSSSTLLCGFISKIESHVTIKHLLWKGTLQITTPSNFYILLNGFHSTTNITTSVGKLPPHNR